MTLHDLTTRVFSFLRHKDTRTDTGALKRKARAIICHTFQLSPIEWACALSCTSYDPTKLDGLWNQHIDADTPLSRIVGQRSFWKHMFNVSEHTLDPRWETEGLITHTLQRMSDPRLILDLGTGTGCLLISLLKEYPKAQGVGVDVCPHALNVAQKNAQDLAVHTRCQWIQSHWFDNIPVPTNGFDIIVTNPPYIPDNTSLPPIVTLWDPPTALFAGPDGLDAYRAIFPSVPSFLSPNGLFIGEIGHDQGLAVKALAAHTGLPPLHIHTDDAQQDRYFISLK